MKKKKEKEEETSINFHRCFITLTRRLMYMEEMKIIEIKNSTD